MGSCLKNTFFLVSGIIAILSIAIGLYWSTLIRFRDLYFSYQSTKSFNLNQCKYLDKSLFGCEDIEIIGDYAVIACGNQKGRMKWWPPINRFDKSAQESDAVYAYDFAERTLEKLNLLRHPTNFLSLHGISAIPGAKENKILIGLINHAKNGSVVELFDHRVGTNEMIYRETIRDPLIHHPNSLALLSPTSFYLTNTMLPNQTTYWSLLTSLLKNEGTGNIVFRSETKDMKLIKSNLITPNGIAVMGSLVYVVLSATGQLMVMEKNSHDGRLRTMSTITLPYIADNVFIVKETGQVLLTGALVGHQLHSWFQTPLSIKLPSGIFMVQNNTRKDSQFYGDRYVLFKLFIDAEGKLLNFPSKAAIHWPSKKMLIGGPMMKGLIECDWPSIIKEHSK